MPKKAPGNRITNFLRVTRLGLNKTGLTEYSAILQKTGLTEHSHYTKQAPKITLPYIYKTGLTEYSAILQKTGLTEHSTYTKQAS